MSSQSSRSVGRRNPRKKPSKKPPEAPKAPVDTTPSAAKRPPKVRLIRNIAAEEINEMLADLERRGFWVVNVLVRTMYVVTKRGETEFPVYDILVAGEESPFWNVWGDTFHG